MNILISTITRNRAKYIDTWFEQIVELQRLAPQHNFSISLYENDSTDDTVDKLNQYKDSPLFDYFHTEKIDTPYFGSVEDATRVHNIATARNKTLDNVYLNKYDKVVVIESDIRYNPEEVLPIFESNYDIYTPFSVHYDRCYDLWAVRRHPYMKLWDGTYTTGIHKLWSTFNCFCAYKAKPLQEGIRFSGWSRILNTWDCDTAVICENFQVKGYSEIYTNFDIKVYP